MIKTSGRAAWLVALAVLCYTSLDAQSPGLIVIPSSGSGPATLNPNSDRWTSATTAGFTTSDISQSEIGYKVIPPIITEPTGDLATGPSGGYSDIVKSVDGSGCYMYYDGTNILFRIRIGSIVSGAKAYNILFDTDLKLGASGPNADPYYVAPTNSGNGNPGFEWEVALETGTNGKVAVYNVDGIINPSVSSSYSLSTNHLISVALTRDNSNADYFYDFFVPRTALGLSASSAFRIVVTTNTNPGSAFQGTRSDIYGINDALFPNTTDAWEYVGKNSPSFTLDNVSSSGGGVPPVCTTAPVVNTGIASGSNVSVTGTWTRMDASKPSTATITVYKNSISQGTTTCNTGGSWNFTIATITTGDVITAQALSAGESMCLLSNPVVATSCSPANTSLASGFVLTCLSNRGAGGTKTDGARVKLYTIAYNGNLTLFADDASTTYKVTYNGTANPSGTTAWEYQHSSNGGTTDPCGGGSPDMPTTNSYVFTITEPGKCESAPIWPATCLIGSTTATPVITQTVLYPGTNTISGSSAEAANSTIRLMVNGFIVQSANIGANGAYSFSNVVLQTGDVVTVRSQASAKCISNAATVTVTCFTKAPIITTDAQGYLTTGATTVSGISSEPTGTTIRVYLSSPVTLTGTTTVQAGGTWSAAVSPAIAGGSSYYATAQNGSCSVSASSSSATARTATTVCPTITGTYAEGASPVSGTFASAFSGTVYLYQDGAQIGSTTISSSTNWSITIAADNPLAAGGVLTVAAQATGATLNRSCASTTTVACSAPATPVISPTSTTINTGQAVTYTVNSTLSGVLYSIMDAASGASYSASKFGDGNNQTFTTSAFSTAGTYNIVVQADKLSGSSCISSATATITVSGILPATWLSFTASKAQQSVLLKWITSSEINTKHFIVQRSTNGTNWQLLGMVTAAINSVTETAYQFSDNNPATGVNYYRLVSVDQDDRSGYSKVATVVFSTKAGLAFYPNPVTDGKLFIQLPEPSVIRILNSTGQEMLRQSLTAGNHLVSTGSLPKGVYMLQAREGVYKLIVR